MGALGGEPGAEPRKLVQPVVDDASLPMPFDQIQCADLRDRSGKNEALAWRQVLDSLADLVGPAAVQGTRPPRPQ